MIKNLLSSFALIFIGIIVGLILKEHYPGSVEQNFYTIGFAVGTLNTYIWSD
jgi:hypothetical protein